VSASFFKDVNEMVETNWRGGVSKEDWAHEYLADKELKGRRIVSLRVKST
jgi:hypothetical protein